MSLYSRTSHRLFVLGVSLLLVSRFLFNLDQREDRRAIAADDSLHSESIVVNGLRRSYLYYIPEGLPHNAPLLFMFHGASQGPQGIRQMTGNEFERLADQKKFVLVYPEGYKGNWNDCRKAAPFPAHTQNINDIAFVSNLINQFASTNYINTKRVFAAGYSNGGQFAYRLALEAPNKFAGVAAIAANMPTEQNNDCHPSGKPIPVMIITGTNDPINPYNGGVESLFGRQSRGGVLSSVSTATYFATLDGQDHTPDTSILPHQRKSGNTSVTSADYYGDNRPEVILYSVINGGHVVPNPNYQGPRRIGQNTQDLDAPQAVWNFFSTRKSRS